MPLFWLSIAFLAGVLVGALLAIPALFWLGGAFSALLMGVVILFVRVQYPGHKIFAWANTRLPGWWLEKLPAKDTFVLFPLLVGTLALGAGRFQAYQPDLSDPKFIAAYNDTGKYVTLNGVVRAPPSPKDTYMQLRVQVDELRFRDSIHHIPVSGIVLVQVESDTDWAYGDRMLVTGLLETPSEYETFSYRDYLNRQGVYSLMRWASGTRIGREEGSQFLGSLYGFRQKALDILTQLFPDPAASVLSAVLLGEDGGIPNDLKADFQDTGLAHMTAISGFHVAVLSGILVLGGSQLLGKRWGAVFAVTGIGLYTVMVGAHASVVRAGLMGSIAIFARQTNRRRAGVNILAFTAASMAFLNPLVPWDVGFQLSFLATLGILLYLTPFTHGTIWFLSRYMRLSTAERVGNLLGTYVLISLAAQILTLPVVAYYFQRISWVSLLANPLISPVQPAVLVFAGAAVLAGFLFLPLGKLLAPLALVLTQYTLRMVTLMAKIPAGGFIMGRIPVFAVWVIFGVILLITLALSRYKRASEGIKAALSRASYALLVFAGLMSAVVWSGTLSSHDGNLHIAQLDSGDGETFLIQTPTGRFLLVGGGESGVSLSADLGERLPSRSGLDFWVISAPFEAHIAALPNVLGRFPPGEVLWAGPLNASSSARYLRELLASEQIRITTAEAGMVLDLGDGATLEVLTTGKRGGVLLLTWMNFRACFPIGADFETMEALRMGKHIGPVSVLSLAENGLVTMNPPEWISNLHPQLVLLSVSAGNRDGLPSPETLEALDGYYLLRTDQNGWVHIKTDGQKMWVRTERQD